DRDLAPGPAQRRVAADPGPRLDLPAVERGEPDDRLARGALGGNPVPAQPDPQARRAQRPPPDAPQAPQLPAPPPREAPAGAPAGNPVPAQPDHQARCAQRPPPEAPQAQQLPAPRHREEQAGAAADDAQEDVRHAWNVGQGL